METSFGEYIGRLVRFVLSAGGRNPTSPEKKREKKNVQLLKYIGTETFSPCFINVCGNLILWIKNLPCFEIVLLS